MAGRSKYANNAYLGTKSMYILLLAIWTPRTFYVMMRQRCLPPVAGFLGHVPRFSVAHLTGDDGDDLNDLCLNGWLERLYSYQCSALLPLGYF